MRILLVEDDEILLNIMSLSLTYAGHKVDSARTLADATHLWMVQPVDVVRLDLNMPVSAEAGARWVADLTRYAKRVPAVTRRLC